MEMVPVVVFADFTCPFSYVTEAALWRRAAAGGVVVEYRAYELFPAPAPLPQAAEPFPAALRELAAAEGVELRPPAYRPRTAKAHELFAFARARGPAEALRSALYRAHWAEGRDIGRIDVLLQLAQDFALDAEEAKIALDIDHHADGVRRDRSLAERLGIHATPAVQVGTGERAHWLLGAHAYAALDEAVRAAGAAG